MKKNFIFNWDRLNWKLAYFRYRRWVNCGECSVTLVTSCLIHMGSGVLASFKKSLERCGDFWHITTMTFGEVFSGFQKSAPRQNLVNTPGCFFCWRQNGSRCGPRMPITQFIQDHRRNIGWRQWKFFRFSSLLDEYDFCCFSFRDLPSEWVVRGPVPEAYCWRKSGTRETVSSMNFGFVSSPLGASVTWIVCSWQPWHSSKEGHSVLCACDQSSILHQGFRGSKLQDTSPRALNSSQSGRAAFSVW